MKNLKFVEHILPHIIAILAFVIVTTVFFKPAFFDNKTLEQHDIQQFMGSAKPIVDYRAKYGEEPLWTNSMFSGMPAYLVSVEWGNKVIGLTKSILAVFLPHPYANIYLAFFCYYIMLLAFRVRPYLAIAGALAFGLSSYMMIGIMAGHNARVGAIAFLPLVMAGIHLAFSGKKILGFGLTTAGLALHLRENHVQMTYYFLMIVAVYGLIRLIEAIREKQVPQFFKTIGILVPAGIIAFGTFFGQFWALKEYEKYSTRGKSELNSPVFSKTEGTTKEWAFEYSNGILEPMVLLIPNFYGGASSSYLVSDRDSETFKALQNLANQGNEQAVNQLYQYTRAYWGPQFNTAPYYAGAIVVFLFAVGIAFAERKYVWWLLSVSLIGIVLSWGSSFPAFNYFMFDYFPAYNKFRSVTFTLFMALFAMPLLGLMGIERMWNGSFDKHAKRKLVIAFAATGGLCLLLLLFAGVFSFLRDGEEQLPAWFTDALIADRKSLFRSDAFRSFAFISGVFILLYFDVHKKISTVGFYAFLILMVTIDLSVVSTRYFSAELYKRKRDKSFLAQTEADAEILRDKSYYRVYNPDFQEARTSYYHMSVGGYHGAKLKRYQDFYDSCLLKQTQSLFSEANQGRFDLSKYNAINMLNVKYIVVGPQRNNVLANPSAFGPAWFAPSVVKVNSPTEELEQTCSVSPKTAVIDASNFPDAPSTSDSTGTITLTSNELKTLKYESSSSSEGLVVFSEIYYPGWVATIDGKEVPVMRANYLLRALEVPAGKHSIEFTFAPKAYAVGNKVTTASSWLVLIILAASLGYAYKKENS
ncbi:MAG TPA: YfhO family protein [Chryseosolibacter sp.]